MVRHNALSAAEPYPVHDKLDRSTTTSEVDSGACGVQMVASELCSEPERVAATARSMRTVEGVVVGAAVVVVTVEVRVGVVPVVGTQSYLRIALRLTSTASSAPLGSSYMP